MGPSHQSINIIGSVINFRSRQAMTSENDVAPLPLKVIVDSLMFSPGGIRSQSGKAINVGLHVELISLDV